MSTALSYRCSFRSSERRSPPIVHQGSSRSAMPRPHIEFVQPQQLPFQQARMGPTVGPETEVRIKTLSFDHESRASSGLVEIPAGWRLPGVHHFTVDTEMYVLSGDITVSGIT